MTSEVASRPFFGNLISDGVRFENLIVRKPLFHLLQ